MGYIWLSLLARSYVIERNWGWRLHFQC